MGAPAWTAAHEERALSAVVPALGMNLAGLRAAFDAVAASFPGGVEAAATSMTSTTVRDFIVKLPLTRDMPSMRHWMEKEGLAADVSAPANVFIMHTYGCSYGKLVETVAAWEAEQASVGEPGPYFYYFRPVINDYVNGEDGPHCHAAIRNTSRTLCILDWDNPTVLRRIWCMYEASCVLASATSFELAMHPADKAKMLSQLDADPSSITALIRSVDALKAEAYSPLELERLHPQIAARPGGHAAVNHLFTTALAFSFASACLTRAMAASASPGEGEGKPALDDAAVAACTLLLTIARDSLREHHSEVRTLHADSGNVFIALAEGSVAECDAVSSMLIQIADLMGDGPAGSSKP